MTRHLFCALVLWTFAAILPCMASEPGAIPVAAIKSVVVDGKLDEWRNVKPIGDWNSPDKIVWGKERFASSKDLGGQAWLGWDQENLYIAADVVDDEHRQAETGENIYRGDHVIVLLDMDRDADRDVLQFNSDDFQIGLSPGALIKGGDLLSNRPPEAWGSHPQYVQNSGISVVAQKTATGYGIEAAIPWAFLNVKPSNALRFAADVCPSDTDGPEATQQTLASLRPGKWSIGTTDRLIDMQLTGGPAIGVQRRAIPTAVLQRKELQIEPNQEKTFEVSVPADTGDLLPLVQLQARCMFDTLAGASSGLVVLVNGQPLDAASAMGKPQSVTFARGDTQSLYGADSWTLFYSPDFAAIHTDIQSPYYIAPGVTDVYRHSLNAKGMLKAGKNSITIRYAAANGATAKMAIANLMLKWMSAEESKRTDDKIATLKPVVAAPGVRLKPATSVKLTQTGAIQFSAISNAWQINSQYSQPGGKWLSMGEKPESGWKSQHHRGDLEMINTSEALQVSRTVKLLGECIEIHDTLKNLSAVDLPVMVRHTLNWPLGQVARMTLNGREIALKRGISANAFNPTLVMEHASGGAIGLVAVDDILRVHHQLFYLDNTAGLADSSLVIPPAKEYEQVWQIYVIPSGTYWDLINAARRYFDSNFTIDGPQVFIDPRRASKLHFDMTPERMREWLAARNANTASIMMVDTVSGAYVHGLKFKLEADQLADLNKIVDTIRQASPNVRVAHYFHCFLTGPGAAPDCDSADAMLEPDGSQSCYGGDKAWPIFIPTPANKFGKAMMAQVQEMVEKLRLSALYWDESQYCDHQYHYGQPWDGCSGDIDSSTHELTRKKSHVALLSLPFRHQLLQWLQDHDIPATLNSPPMTSSEMKFKVRHFTETGSVTNLFDTHLFTPIGLSDHLSERSHDDTVRLQREFLNRGCLYDYYSPSLVVRNPGLVRWMYPIKPVAIGPGFVVAEDRILASASGRFNFGAAKLPDVEVHVVDEHGDEVRSQFEKITQGGQEWIDLKLATRQMAAIVVKK